MCLRIGATIAKPEAQVAVGSKGAARSTGAVSSYQFIFFISVVFR